MKNTPSITIPSTPTPTSFVHINPSSGEGNGVLSVTCYPTDSTIMRTKRITIAGNGITKTINVTQNAKSAPNLYFVGATCSLNGNTSFHIDTEPSMNSVVVYNSSSVATPIITLRALPFPHDNNDDFEITWNFNESGMMVYPDDTINFTEVTILGKSVITKGISRPGRICNCTIEYQQKYFKIEVLN